MRCCPGQRGPWMLIALLAAIAAGTAAAWPTHVQAAHVMAGGSTYGSPTPPPHPNV
jgi:hypothetical protein